MERQLIGRFIFAVVLALFLDGVIGEVDHATGKIVKGEGLPRGADVSLFVPISFDHAVNGGYQYVATDIKFAFFVEERNNVLL